MRWCTKIDEYELCREANYNQEKSWNKNCQQKVDNWSAQGHFYYDCLYVVDDRFAHMNPIQSVARKRYVSVILQIPWVHICIGNRDCKLHGTHLCVKRVPVVHIVTFPVYAMFSLQTKSIL